MKSEARLGQRLRLLALTAAATASALLGASAHIFASENLSTGKRITIAPDSVINKVGSLPVNIVASADGKWAITTDAGFRESLNSINLATGLRVDGILFENTATPTRGLYYGLTVGTDGTIYAGTGADGKVAEVTINSTTGRLKQVGVINGKTTDFIAGVATDIRGYLYAANNEFYDPSNSVNPHDVTDPGSLAVYKLSDGTEAGRVTFPTIVVNTALGPIAPTNYPLATAVLHDGSKVFVSSERDGKVYVVNASDPTKPVISDAITVGDKPEYLILSPDEQTLYVSSANSDLVTAINTSDNSIKFNLSVRPSAAPSLPGVSPLGLAISPDGSKLYVALADFDAIGVIDLNSKKVAGYIPTGWNPTSLVATKDKLLVVDAKGTDPRNPNSKPVANNGTYILNIIEGRTQTLPVPTSTTLPIETQQVYSNNHINQLLTGNRLANISRSSGRITHVIYVIKENRTYDQVLGDVSTGNGDPSLTLFGQSVTPNAHALVKRFVLLDNFFDSGDVSGDGWNWSVQGYANASDVRNLPYNYSGRGRQYDFEGQNNGYLTGGFPANDPYGKPLSSLFPTGAPTIPDVSQSGGGHIWDAVRAAGLSYRNYGFFYSFGVPGLLPDNYPSALGLLPAGHDYGGISDVDFRRFDTSFADSDAGTTWYSIKHNPADLDPETTYGHYGVSSRFKEWKREFDAALAADPTGAKVPAFQTIRLMKDHTAGASSGQHTPRSMVADNDYAIGQLVDEVSKSPIWKHTAIFIIEDDAQDGQDHVDSHRSVAYVISPYIAQGAVDHRFYNTDSILKTIENLLEIAPLSTYDGVASPILDWTNKPLNDAKYKAILPAESIIAEHNPTASTLKRSDPRAKIAHESDKLDFKHPDSAPAAEVNTIIWKTVKGANTNPPLLQTSRADAALINQHPAVDSD